MATSNVHNSTVLFRVHKWPPGKGKTVRGCRMQVPRHYDMPPIEEFHWYVPSSRRYSRSMFPSDIVTGGHGMSRKDGIRIDTSTSIHVCQLVYMPSPPGLCGVAPGQGPTTVQTSSSPHHGHCDNPRPVDAILMKSDVTKDTFPGGGLHYICSPSLSDM